MGETLEREEKRKGAKVPGTKPQFRILERQNLWGGKEFFVRPPPFSNNNQLDITNRLVVGHSKRRHKWSSILPCPSSSSSLVSVCRSRTLLAGWLPHRPARLVKPGLVVTREIGARVYCCGDGFWVKYFISAVTAGNRIWEIFEA